MNHADASPNRGWYAGETADYGGSPIPFALFRKGETAVYEMLWQHSFSNVVWTDQNHVNPAFSHDGTRIYFNYAVDSNRSVAAYVDIADIIRVKASHVANSNPAIRTVDGEFSTFWSTDTRGAWIRYDLGGSEQISSVAIMWKYNNQYRFFVEMALNTEESWSTVFEGKSEGIGGVFERYSFPSLETRFVRITVDGRDDNQWAHITEVNLLSPDEDGDGLTEIEEIAFGSDYSLADTDEDGFNDLAEWIAGTDPCDAKSRFALRVIRGLSGRSLEFPAVAGRTYQIDSADHLNGAWSPLFSEIIGIGRVIFDISENDESARFYRGRVWK